MSRTMYDALYTKGIPANVPMAAYYPYDNPDNYVPSATQIMEIDNSAGGSHPDCQIADAETGAMEWADVPGWVERCTRAQPTVYASLSNVPTLVSAMNAAGLTTKWWLWVADYLSPPQPVVPAVPGLPASCAGVIGCQYTDTGPYDLSIITDDNWYPIGGGDTVAVAVQDNWSVCGKCHCLFYSGTDLGPAPCAAGGDHAVLVGSYPYAVLHD